MRYATKAEWAAAKAREYAAMLEQADLARRTGTGRNYASVMRGLDNLRAQVRRYAGMAEQFAQQGV